MIQVLCSRRRIAQDPETGHGGRRNVPVRRVERCRRVVGVHVAQSQE